MNNATEYIGDELQLFSKANNWKEYYGKFIRPYLKGKVLEVGAGIGGTTTFLCDGTQELWTCLEPDFNNASYIKTLISKEKIPSCCSVSNGTIDSLSDSNKYDSIIYIDVIEHIKKDKLEMELAAQHLNRGGKIIILVPAHQSLFSAFDKAIGHHRRYNKGMLSKVIPSSLKEVRSFYLDSVGMFASIANKLFLRQSYPTEKQIKFWNEVLVKASKCIDPILLNSLGKSLLCVWEKK